MASSKGKNAINLKGSADIVTEFFGYGINSILYQRGIYPPEQFERKQKYGLTMLVTNDDALRTYLRGILSNLRDWLMQKTVQKVVVVFADKSNGETVERWQFDIACDKTVDENSAPVNKSEKDVHSEIQGIIRQITASVSFLPVIETACTFEILIYTDNDADVPQAWQDSDAKLVRGASDVFHLRKFTTTIHSVKSVVSYRDNN